MATTSPGFNQNDYDSESDSDDTPFFDDGDDE